MLDGRLWERVTLARLTSETGSGSLPTPVKYDSHGTWESNNYHGLGWQAKHGDAGFRPAGEYPKGYAPGQKIYPTPIRSDASISKNLLTLQKVENGEAFDQLARTVRREEMEARGEYVSDPGAVAGRRVVDAEEAPLPVETDGVTANSAGITRRPIYPTPMTKGMDGGSNSRKAFAARNPEAAQATLGGSYPTPTAQDSDKRRSKKPPPAVRFTASGLPEADRPSGSGAQLTLAQAAHIRDGTGQKLYPTPMTGGMESGGGLSSKRKFVLLDEMRKEQEGRRLPTPTSQNGLRSDSKSEHYPGKWQSPGHPEYGELNPKWVEWIMGWPLGWTSPDPINEYDFEAWQERNLCDGMVGGTWWRDDPSDDPAASVPKTVVAGDKEAEAVRVGRIAALGNGQVSAVVAAVWTHLWELEMPTGEGDY